MTGYLVHLPDFRSESNTPMSLLKLIYLTCSKRLLMTETAQPPAAIFVLPEPSLLQFKPITSLSYPSGPLFVFSTTF